MGRMNWEIRNYREADQKAVEAFFAEVFDQMGFDFNLDDKDKDLSRIPDEYQTRDGLFLVANNEGNIVGSIALRRLSDDALELKRFYVLHAVQHHGVGTELMKHALEHAGSKGFKAVRLDTTLRSQEAIALFKKHGFTEIPRFNDDPFAEIFMELTV